MEMKTCPTMNLNSSQHTLLFLLLNVSVPDQSDSICSKVLRSPTAKGERGRRKKGSTGKGSGRATGDEEEMKRHHNGRGGGGQGPG